jgi:hypothetical protein
MQPTSPVARSPLTALWVACLATLGAQTSLLLVLVVLGYGATAAGVVWLTLPVVLGFANLVLVPAVGSTVRPLPYEATPETARRISIRVLATVTYLRLALSQSSALIGFVASLAAASQLPYLIGLLFALPLLLWFVMPRRRIVDDVRQRLESSGVVSHLADPAHR